MKALIVVDIQNDFCPGGALAVSKGDEVVPVANRLITSCKFDLIVATQDWHIPGHGCFASVSDQPVGTLGDLNGIPQVWWPDHCVWGTKGADFHKNLLIGRVNLILRKGFNKNVDSYSAFNDNAKKTTGLAEYLKSQGVTDIYVLGLATDYCVKFTATDGVDAGFKTHLVVDGCRAVNLKPNDGEKSITDLELSGVEIVDSATLLKKL
jgi:nicotinamidase/pyrazinamidase